MTTLQTAQRCPCGGLLYEEDDGRILCLDCGRSLSERNREQVAARNREYYERNREQVAARNREYYERNREQVAARKREYRERNREQVAAYQREYRERNRKCAVCFMAASVHVALAFAAIAALGPLVLE